jgi:hypothetical protein
MSRTHSTIWRRSVLAAIAALAVGSCGGGDPEPGAIRFALTDAPACGFDQVNVSVERIRVHRNADAGVNATGWTDLRFEPARRLDLLKLQNGVLEELGRLSLPASRYAQFRLLLAAGSGGSLANSVVPAGGVETELALPADAPDGIRVVSQVTVDEDKTTDVLFDFDACRSVVPTGTNGYRLKPVVRVAPRNGVAITGYVDPALAGVAVSAQKAGRVQRATVADANGRFVLAFLDPASAPFDVVFTAVGRTTAVVTGVPLTTSAGAELSRMDAPIVLPASAARAASGTVGPAAARDTAVIGAMQLLGSATIVEVARRNGNASTGSWSLDLPTAQPRLAAYSTRLPLTFSVSGTAARYTLEASAEGFETQAQLIDLSNSAATWSPTLLRQ